MKKVLLILTAIILFGCEKPKEELMVQDFIKEKLKEANIDIEDTDFEMVSVKQIETVKAKDSLPYFESKLKTEKESMIDSYYRLLIPLTRMGDTVNIKKTKMSIEAVENNTFENMPDLIALNNKMKEYDNDNVISTVYEATYKISSMGQKRTITNKYYSNKDNTKIVSVN